MAIGVPQPETEWTPQTLAAYVSRHNRRVLFVTAVSLLTALALWWLVYAVLKWLVLLGLAAVKGLDAPQETPEMLLVLFLYAAGTLLLISWFLRKYSRPTVREEKTGWEYFVDFVLAIPRATLSGWENLSAMCRLKPQEFHYAAMLLQRLARDQKLPIRSVPQEIPNRTMRRNIVLALQLTGLIEYRKVDDVLALRLTPQGKAGPNAED